MPSYVAAAAAAPPPCSRSTPSVRWAFSKSNSGGSGGSISESSRLHRWCRRGRLRWRERQCLLQQHVHLAGAY